MAEPPNAQTLPSLLGITKRPPLISHACARVCVSAIYAHQVLATDRPE